MTTRIGTVTLFGFERYLILALSSAWMKVLGNATFDVAIVKGRLQITSCEKLQK